jgi:hypothetical protein
MGDNKLPRRRDNKIYGSLWVNSEHGGAVPGWMWIGPLIMLGIMAVGCFGLVVLGWDGTPGFGP